MLGCTKHSNQQFYYIVNEHFLTFIDTQAYNTGSLFLIPNDTTKYENADNIIEVDTAMGNDQRLGYTLKTSLIKLNKNDFVELVSENEIFVINLPKLTNVGKFKIIAPKPANKFNNAIMGKIRFSNFTHTQNRAVLIVSKQSSPKSGVSNAYLFTKHQNNWRIDTVIELERW